MLIRLGDVIYWIGTVCAVLWLVAGIWVYYINPDPPSEATFVLLMFIGSAILIYAGGWCVRCVIVGGLVIWNEGFFVTHLPRLAALAMRHKKGATWRPFAIWMTAMPKKVWQATNNVNFQVSRSHLFEGGGRNTCSHR